ncbi:MAG: hypothetical protein VX331_02750 [Candidatus Thermoplasmatota archaeon]|nr:hypothetical protein [Candidatus Thermoplasmatota archaeon]MEE3030109.1 hypothetical protein [Candidatus Thermoplasmatota archaeon]
MPPEGEENRETKTEDEIQTEINKIGFVNLVTIVILHFELNVTGVEKEEPIEEMAVIEEVEMETVEINDFKEIVGETAVIEEVEMETVEVNDFGEMIEGQEIENLEEINPKIKVEMEIGLAKVVEIITSHSELNVIGVEKRKAVVILALEGKEVIAEDRTIDPNEGQAIMENDVKIQGVDSIVQITEGILEVVVAQTTLEIEIDVD